MEGRVTPLYNIGINEKVSEKFGGTEIKHYFCSDYEKSRNEKNVVFLQL